RRVRRSVDRARPGLPTVLPATVLLPELLPLVRVEPAVDLVILAQPLLLLGRQRLELPVTLLERALALLGQLAVALVVLPGALPLLGGELAPRSPARPRLRGRDGRAEQERGEEQRCAHHPFDWSSSRVVVRIASKCCSLSMLRRIGRSTKRSGSAASSGGGSAGATCARRVGVSRRATACDGAAACEFAAVRVGAASMPSGADPVRHTPTASITTAVVAMATAGTPSTAHHGRARVSLRSRSSAASRRTRRSVSCSSAGGTSA